MRLLLAEDTAALARSVAQGLREEGYTVDVVGDGESAMHLASEVVFDGLVLDRMMPKLDGLSVLTQLRARGVQTPVLLLTALGEVDDRIAGLNAGADDYLIKPFAFAELLARVRALLRRSVGQPTNVMSVGPLVLDLAARSARANGVLLDLTSSEYSVLELLVTRPGTTWSRTPTDRAPLQRRPGARFERHRRVHHPAAQEARRRGAAGQCPHSYAARRRLPVRPDSGGMR